MNGKNNLLNSCDNRESGLNNVLYLGQKKKSGNNESLKNRKLLTINKRLKT